MDNEFTTNNVVTETAVEETPVEVTEETTEPEVKEDGQVRGQDFEPGPDDIVIEEDFDIQLDIKPVSADLKLGGPTTGTVGVQTAEPAQPVNLGTEQTGNITF